jgi:hypothetical protein
MGKEKRAAEELDYGAAEEMLDSININSCICSNTCPITSASTVSNETPVL